MNTSFKPEDTFSADDQTLDALPFGFITLDKSGTIRKFNRYEAELGRKDQREVIGQSFFKDVAPCTAVQDFKGRFDVFVTKRGYASESFDFTFKFAWGAQRVHITFIKKDDAGEVNVLVSRVDA